MEELATAIGSDKAAGCLARRGGPGWYPPSQQVGLTGKVVNLTCHRRCDLGASQHGGCFRLRRCRDQP
jgi:hypothetical protein